MSCGRALSDLLANSPPIAVAGAGVATEYAGHLLRDVGGLVERVVGTNDPHPALDWARSGAMALTGYETGPPLPAPGPLASCARGAVVAFELLTAARRRPALDGAALLGEHAAAFGLHRRGAIAPGGTCRLLRAADRWIALNLARPEDVASLPAWFAPLPAASAALSPSASRMESMDESWACVAAEVAKRPAAELVERAHLLGLPATIAAPPRADVPAWCRIAAAGPRRSRASRENPLVVDLSSLWAGPLCGHLLARAGARVVKVESTRRPDGARAGAPAFFDLLNADKASVALDFGSEAGRARLRDLLQRADIVIESARPRALAQLGIAADEIVESTPGKVWVSVTGYGRSEPESNWVAFGDDAAVAAGLAVATGSAEAPIFCGDAIADPLTGIHAAVAAQAAWVGGGGALLDLSLRDVTAHAATRAFVAGDARIQRDPEKVDGWEVIADGERAAVAAPRLRPATGVAPALGADTRETLRDLGIPC
jgi:crotonobetainyl-CoA:carnitine CoA-transferase CaiB-like acyl-CoA transferase